jgi:hypothetical protein
MLVDTYLLLEIEIEQTRKSCPPGMHPLGPQTLADSEILAAREMVRALV